MWGSLSGSPKRRWSRKPICQTHRAGLRESALRVPPSEIATVLWAYSVGVLGKGSTQNVQWYRVPGSMEQSLENHHLGTSEKASARV